MSERIFKPLDGELPAISFINAAKLDKEEFKGVVMEGEFIATVPNKFSPDKPDFKFMKDDGSIVIVNQCGSLNKQMGKVEIGDYLQISYVGKKILTTGSFKGKSCHEFKVLKA